LELSTALLFGAAYLTYGLSAQLAIMLFFGAALLLIFAYDLKHQIIPDVIVIPAIAFALATISLQFAFQMSGSSTEILLTASTATPYALGGLFFGGFFLALYVLSKGTWIGGGDIKLGLLLGLLVGWPLVLVNLVLAYLIGTLYAVVMLVSRRASLKTYLPFGPMLVMAFFITAYYGEQIANWYETWFL
jgi:prepilin signal peptidase PulO-like enzyme (type II secretory pathway)